MRAVESTLLLLPALLLLALAPTGCRAQRANLNVFAQTFDGQAIPQVCASCTYVRDGVYYRTDAQGAVTANFSCALNEAAERFCQSTALNVISSYQPNAAKACPTRREPKTCLQKLQTQITLWSDYRLGPRYPTLNGTLRARAETGEFRDAAATGTVRLLYGGGAVVPDPDAPALPDTGEMRNSLPDSNAANMMWYPYRVGNTYSVTASWYHLSNTLLMYDDFAPRPFFDLLQRSGRLRAFYTDYFRYLTSHRKIRMQGFLTMTVTSRVTRLPTPDQTYLRRGLQLRYGCGAGGGCFFFQDVRPSQTSVFMQGLDGVMMTVGWPQTYVNGSTVNPTVLDPPSDGGDYYVEHLVDPWINSDNDFIPHMLFALQLKTPAEVLRTKSALVVFEAGANYIWRPHPASGGDLLYRLLDSGSAADVWNFFRGTTLCRDMNGDCVRWFTPTGDNRYLRIVFYTFVGFGTGTRGQLSFPISAYYFTAEERANGLLYYVPAYLPGRENGREACLDVPNCRVLETMTPLEAQAWYYPTPARAALFATPAAQMTPEGMAVPAEVRTRFLDRVVSVLYSNCDRSELDPVTLFTWNPGAFPERCLRLDDDPLLRVCYRSNATADYADAAIRVLNDVFNQRLRYQLSGFEMTVLRRRVPPDYNVADFVAGRPFTPTRLQPAFYLYSRAPSESRAVPMTPYYVALSEQCDFANATVPALQRDQTCNCTNFQFSQAVCLCELPPEGAATLDQLRYRELDTANSTAIRQQALLQFAAVDVPLEYTVQSVNELHDTQLFTTVDIDCRAYLCSGSPDCLTLLAKSNYLTFCENQRVIAQTIMSDLRDAKTRVEKGFDEAVRGGSGSLRPVYTGAPTLSAQTVPATPEYAPLRQRLQQYEGLLDTFTARLSGTGLRNLSAGVYEDSRWVSPPVTGFNTLARYFFENQKVYPELGEKMRDLWLRSDALNKGVEVLFDRTAELANTVGAAVSTAAHALVAVTDSYNSLIATVNANTATNERFQSDFNNALLALRYDVADLNGRLNYLDLVSSRANTLAVQLSSIFSRAADYAIRFRELEEKVKLCRNYRTASGDLCAGIPNAEIVQTTMLNRNRVLIVNMLVRVPTRVKTVYAGTAFCYQDRLYEITDPHALFAVDDGAMVVTPRRLYVPTPLTDPTAQKVFRVRASCAIAGYSFDGTNVRIPSAPELRDAQQGQLFTTLTQYNVTTARLTELASLVNITEQLGVLSDLISTPTKYEDLSTNSVLSEITKGVALEYVLSIAAVTTASAGLALSLFTVWYSAKYTQVLSPR